MKASKQVIIILLLSALITLATIYPAQAQTIDSAQTAVHNAYEALLEASAAGGDVTELTAQLNHALNLIAQANTLVLSDPVESQKLASQAQDIANNVTVNAPEVKEAGIAQNQISTIILAGTVIALITAGILVYIFGQKIMWKIWLKLRSNYRVTSKPSAVNQKNNLIITSKTVCAAFLIVVIIIASFTIATSYFPNTTETFSELGILGPNMNLGDYPSIIVAGEPINLYGYVGNQMGKPIDYTLLVKLGNNETAINPAPVEAIQQYEQIVPNNGTWLFPINLTLTQTGLNQRLIFELWIYNETINQNQYHNRWGQLWLNVTSPAT
jgi:hypothetical protein